MPKGKKKAYHHGNLRAALIECGLDVIEKKGLRALTLREIGRLLGVSRSAAYAHFKDKAALLSAISEAGFTEFENALEAAKEGAVGFAAQMDAIGVAYARFANEHRAQFDVMFNERLAAGGAAASESRPAFMLMKETIREAQQQGELRQGDPAVLAHVIWAMIHGTTMLRTHADPNFMRLICEALRVWLNDARGGLNRK